ncbi:MAG TPA: head GIN domain-containing protein [Bacteroidia bacterium]|nr:head GIN domain-containing protein [Bacteroidia bacterium]
MKPFVRQLQSAVICGCAILWTGIASASDITTETRTPGDFTSLDLSGVFSITLVHGTSCSVALKGDVEDLKHVKAEVKNKELKLSLTRDTQLKEAIAVTITYVSIDEIEVSGVINLTSEGAVKAEKFSMDMSGTGKAQLEIETAKLDVDISGTGSITLTGHANTADLDISGAGKLLASAMESETCKIEISGVGSAEVNVSKSIDADISGSGTVKYSGTPEIRQSVSGTGKVVKM